nr:MAG TPA: Putative conjugative transposon recombinase [Caudoviricetes sp.]
MAHGQSKMRSIFKNASAPLRLGVYQRVASPSSKSVHSNEHLKARWTKMLGENNSVIAAGFYFDDSSVNAEYHSVCERLLADCQAGKIDAVIVHNSRTRCTDEYHLKQVIKELSNLTPPVDVYISMADNQFQSGV